MLPIQRISEKLKVSRRTIYNIIINYKVPFEWGNVEETHKRKLYDEEEIKKLIKK